MFNLLIFQVLFLFTKPKKKIYYYQRPMGLVFFKMGKIGEMYSPLLDNIQGVPNNRQVFLFGNLGLFLVPFQTMKFLIFA